MNDSTPSRYEPEFTEMDIDVEPVLRSEPRLQHVLEDASSPEPIPKVVVQTALQRPQTLPIRPRGVQEKTSRKPRYSLRSADTRRIHKPSLTQRLPIRPSPSADVSQLLEAAVAGQIENQLMLARSELPERRTDVAAEQSARDEERDENTDSVAWSTTAQYPFAPVHRRSAKMTKLEQAVRRHEEALAKIEKAWGADWCSIIIPEYMLPEKYENGESDLRTNILIAGRCWLPRAAFILEHLASVAGSREAHELLQEKCDLYEKQEYKTIGRHWRANLIHLALDDARLRRKEKEGPQ